MLRYFKAPHPVKGFVNLADRHRILAGISPDAVCLRQLSAATFHG